jgi:hypothetical protein
MPGPPQRGPTTPSSRRPLHICQTTEPVRCRPGSQTQTFPITPGQKVSVVMQPGPPKAPVNFTVGPRNPIRPVTDSASHVVMHHL